jgi:hypothetical protein
MEKVLINSKGILLFHLGLFKSRLVILVLVILDQSHKSSKWIHDTKYFSIDHITMSVFESGLFLYFYKESVQKKISSLLVVEFRRISEKKGSF